MILTIISAVICFSGAVFLFTKKNRTNLLSRPFAIFLIFEGASLLFAHLIRELNPTSALPQYVKAIGLIVIVLYLVFVLLFTGRSSKRKAKNADQEE